MLEKGAGLESIYEGLKRGAVDYAIDGHDMLESIYEGLKPCTRSVSPHLIALWHIIAPLHFNEFLYFYRWNRHRGART
ncbi:MAG: hypothetical protein ACP5ID_06160, partial [Conexivisphaera sp.]